MIAIFAKTTINYEKTTNKRKEEIAEILEYDQIQTTSVFKAQILKFKNLN